MILSYTDICILISYISGVLLLGYYFGGKKQNAKKFMVADRSLPGWVVGFSILGTYVSSISFLANPAKSYLSNWNAWVFGLAIPLAVCISAKFFIPYYRNSEEISAYSLLEKKFGYWARSYASTIYILLQLGRMGTIMYLMSLPLQYMFQLPVWMIIILMGVLVTIYTLIGGIEAVIWTDLIQAIVLMIGSILVVFLLCFQIEGGFSQIISVAFEHNKLSLGEFSLNMSKSTFWIVLLFGLFENLKNFGIDQSYIQRYQSASSCKEAKKSLYLGALLYIPVSAVLFFIGTALFVYYLPGDVSVPSKSDQIFPFFIMNNLPNGLKGLLIAAIFSAGMSSIDSSLNCSATLTLTDFFQRFSSERINDKGALKILRISTLVWGGVATMIALLMIGVKSILDVWWKISGAFGGGLLGLFLLGFLAKNISKKTAVTSLCIGIISIIWISCSSLIINYFPSLKVIKPPFHSFLSIVIGTVLIVFSGFFITFFCNKIKKTNDNCRLI